MFDRCVIRRIGPVLNPACEISQFEFAMQRAREMFHRWLQGFCAISDKYARARMFRHREFSDAIKGAAQLRAREDVSRVG